MKSQHVSQQKNITRKSTRSSQQKKKNGRHHLSVFFYPARRSFFPTQRFFPLDFFFFFTTIHVDHRRFFLFLFPLFFPIWRRRTIQSAFVKKPPVTTPSNYTCESLLVGGACATSTLKSLVHFFSGGRGANNICQSPPPHLC